MIEIRVPATSANLGPGFDVMGLAIDRYNTFGFLHGEGGTQEESLVHVAFNRVYTYLGKAPEPVMIQIKGDVPASRGLGSSATCIVGGIKGADEILGNPLTDDEILQLATEIEGHPDNVAPAIFGGLVVSVMDEGKIHWSQVPIRNQYDFIALVPDFSLSTEKAREVLPEKIPYGDGIHNVGRASLLLTALVTGQDHLLRTGLQDRLHQPYRGELIPGFDRISKAVYQMGALGCYLSGAGPTIMALAKKDDDEFLKSLGEFMESEFPRWNVYPHNVENIGAKRIL